MIIIWVEKKQAWGMGKPFIAKTGLSGLVIVYLASLTVRLGLASSLSNSVQSNYPGESNPTLDIDEYDGFLYMKELLNIIFLYCRSHDWFLHKWIQILILFFETFYNYDYNAPFRATRTETYSQS